MWQIATSKRIRRSKPAPLEEYRRKRDFRKTREPEGKPDRNARRRTLQFVIQKHAASSLHYDLRLELDGVMRSWAVPKGPSLDPSVKRLAMQVEDHPMEYNTFEGTIPAGEYGGGTVMLWDRGSYVPDEAKEGEDHEKAVRRGLEAGKLSFTFAGERLRGSFALVRTDRGPKPKWLLIKHRDADASQDVDITREVLTSVATGRTMDEIASEGDRVWRSNRGGSPGGEEPGEPTAADDAATIAPMRPGAARNIPDEGEWSWELWRGGEHALAWVIPGTARIVDERSRDITKQHRAIADELAALGKRVKRPFVMDGEIADDGFHVGDLLLDGDDVLMEEAWQDRRAALEALLRRRRLSHIALQQTSTSPDAALRRAQREGAPGIIGRRLDAPYEPGVRSDALRRLTAH